MAIRRGPGLLNTVARTAVVAGTATVTSSAIIGRQQKKAAAAQQQQAESQEIAQLEQQIAQLQADQFQAQVTPVAAPAPAGGTDVLAQLQQLAKLKEQGLLSDAEFATAKAAILGT
jgi:hypothetical protein